MSIPTLGLNNQRRIPQIGLGLWRVPNHKTPKIVEAAIKIGWRHFDTAQIYGNEAGAGAGMAASGIDRSKLFITTKIWNKNQREENFDPSLTESLKKLQTDYVDLLLLHWPQTETRRPAWRKMEQVHQAGRTRSIGVSNYTTEHLRELLGECSVRPAVNQVELHVYLQQPELVKLCQDEGIVVEAYSPLAHGHGLDNSKLKKVADAYNKSPAQVMIRWCLQQGLVPLPKTTHIERLKENFDVFDFELDDNDLDLIKQLDADYRTCWDPTAIT
jgi:diketogulonate reductase-like aldo/keto reductase